MARIRSVKPEFWSDRSLAKLSRDTRLLYIALWNLSDEHGRLHGDPRFIKGHCLPYDDDLTLGDIDRLLDELANTGRVIRYCGDDDPFLYLPTLSKHQRLGPTKVPSRLPAPPAEADAESSAPRADKSAPDPNQPAPRSHSSEPTVALQVAGSRVQVAGSRYVEQLCELLARRIAENGSKAPVISARWRDAARLLIDVDGRSAAEAAELIDWCQADEFWRSNVLSMPTFREKYDQLRLQRERQRPATSRRVAEGLAIAEALRAEGL